MIILIKFKNFTKKVSLVPSNRPIIRFCTYYKGYLIWMKHLFYYYTYNYNFLLHFSFWFLLNVSFNLYYGIHYYCEENSNQFFQRPYDGRTCYEIMNEPDPYRPYDEDVARIDYLFEKGEIIPYVDCFNAYVPPDSSLDSYNSNNSSYNNDSEESEKSDIETIGSSSSNNSSGSKSMSSSAHTSDNESSEDEKEISLPNKIHIYNTADDILKDFFNKTHAIVDSEEFVSTAMLYAKELIPADMWHKSVEHTRDENSPLNIWLNTFATNATTNTENEKDCFIHFYTTITITNINSFEPLAEDKLVECYMVIADNTAKTFFEIKDK